MRITINLTAAEVRGLKKYLAALEGDKQVKIGRAQIREEVQGMVSCNLQTGAVWDYIKQEKADTYDL